MNGTAVGAAMGLALFVAAYVGHDIAFGLFGLALLTGFGTFVGYSRSEWAVIQGSNADERQRDINARAVQAAYHAVLVVALIGFLSEVVRQGHPGPFTLICAVGGFTHMASIAYLRRRS